MPGTNEELEAENLETENEVLETDDTENQELEHIDEDDEDAKPLTRADLNRFEALMARDRSPRQESRQAPSQGMQLTAEQVSAFKDNPALMLQFMQEQIGQTKREVSQTVNQQRWDSKTYDEYPALKNDASFQNRVKKQIRDLVEDGDFQPNSPKLLYTAAKLAAATYKPKSQSNGQQRQNTTALPTKKKVADPGAGQTKAEFDQKAQFLRMAGYTDDKIKTMLTKYDKSKIEGVTPSGRFKRVVKL